MASVRLLKKDINFLTSELITQAYLNKLLFKGYNEEDMLKSVAGALEFRSSLIGRANSPDGKDNPKLVKSHYSKLRKDMVEKFGEIFDEGNKKAENKKK